MISLRSGRSWSIPFKDLGCGSQLSGTGVIVVTPARRLHTYRSNLVILMPMVVVVVVVVSQQLPLLSQQCHPGLNPSHHQYPTVITGVVHPIAGETTLSMRNHRPPPAWHTSERRQGDTTMNTDPSRIIPEHLLLLKSRTQEFKTSPLHCSMNKVGDEKMI